MKYIIDVPRFGKFFTVPCGAVENYIKTADANYVKVLLCLLCSNSNTADVHKIAEECGVSDSVAEDGILFWQSRKIISAEAVKDEAEAMPAVAASAPVSAPDSEAAAKPVCLTDAINPMKNTAAAKSVVRYSPKDIAEKVKQNKDLQTLFDEIQHVFGRPINGTETSGLLNIYEYYGYDVPSIVMIADFCKSVGKGKIAYIEAVARDWFNRGVCEYSQVEEEIIRQTEQNGYSAAAMRALGLEGKITDKRQGFFTQWKEWGFDEKMIELAGDRCLNVKQKLSLEYTNGILKRWHESGIVSPKDVEQSETAYQQSKADKTSGSGEKTSYDLNKWRSMASHFDPNTIGFEEDDDE